MKKSFSLLMCLLILFCARNSLSQNNAWILAPQYHQVLPTGPGPSLPLPTSSSPEGYHGQAAQYAQNIQMDASGNILFFIVDDKIYDRNGECILSEDPWQFTSLFSYERLQNVNYFSQSTAMNGTASEILIIPDKDDCNLFHIISSGAIHNSPSNFTPQNVGVAYGKLKISYDGNGNITPSSKISLQSFSDANGTHVASMLSLEQIIGIQNLDFNDLVHQRSPTLAVVDNGNSYTVLYRNIQGLYRLTIGNGNISYNNFITIPGSNQMPQNYEMEAVKLANGNIRVAAFNAINNNITGVQIVDITPLGTIVTGSEKTLQYDKNLFSSSGVRYFYGLEFSTDGNRLFVTHPTYNNNSTLDYWDISGTPVKTVLSNETEIGIGQIEMAKDGKMYIPRQNYLARISNINSTPTLNLTALSIPSYSPVLGINSQQPPLRILQDQLDGSNVYDNVQPSTYHATSYNVQTSGVWDGVSNPIAPGSSIINIEKELRIKAGVSVTFKNIMFQFAPGARLVIENGVSGGQGGKLLLDSTTLTNMPVCGKEDMWLGVEVWGNSTVAQGTVLNSSQGVLRMYNNSKIEHAYVGVLLSKRNTDQAGVVLLSSYDNNYNGGVAQVQNSEFLNCQYGMYFNTYTVGSNNLSTISGSTFKWENLFKKPSVKPQNHIHLFKTSAVTITASNFLQETPAVYGGIDQYGKGIYSNNSEFKVYSGCTNIFLPIGQDCAESNTVRSQFKNLVYGVYVVNSNSKPFVVLRNEFTNCSYGVYSIMAKNQTVSRNKFHVAESTGQTCGLYVYRGTGYKIEENIFQEFDNPLIANGSGNSYGLIIYDSDTLHNEVYKNTFSKLKIGAQAQGINGRKVGQNNDGTTGLQFICNEFKSPIYLTDIGVNGRIDKEQGESGAISIQDARKRAARNVFSMYGEDPLVYPTHDIFMSAGSQYIEYTHLADNAHTPDNYTILNVVAHTQTYIGADVYSDANTCPSKFGGKFIIFEPIALKNKSDSLSSKIDGGNTAALMSAIETNPNSIQTQGLLLSKAPYLSDQVLESYFQSGASNAKVKNVLLANFGLSDYLKNKLQASSRSNALKNDVLNFITSFSPRKQLLSELKQVHIAQNDMQRIAISSVLQDNTIANTYDSLEAILKQCVGLDFQESLLELYSWKQDQAKFDELLSQLSSQITAEKSQYYQLIYAVDGGILSSTEIPHTFMRSLENLANQQNDVLVAASAQMLLDELINGEITPVILPLIATPSSRSSMIANEEQNTTALMGPAAIFPNPTSGEVTVLFSEIEASVAQVYLYDLSGKEIMHQTFEKTTQGKLDLSNLKKGSYLIKVSVDGAPIKTNLLVVE